ncbi:hypothetical protein PGB34_02250 [Xenophilus arseniciresistens]|uniref:Uncharacterized protein n=1 Tax=Xenophilus arseniciresistens TaxID=1283306 RepID=A0AAE3SYU9_9BURK|nr:hypothetical protein [Xenophilus arseniciresistens]MDA7415176.1 hypothetical protein [Xenophilus arseniciresistens]
MNAAPQPPEPGSVEAHPLFRRFTSLAGAGGQLREISPRRYLDANGTVHCISAAAIRRGLEAGLLHRERVRSYRVGLPPAA